MQIRLFELSMKNWSMIILCCCLKYNLFILKRRKPHYQFLVKENFLNEAIKIRKVLKNIFF